PVRVAVLAAGAGRDRPGAVRPRPRGTVRLVGGDARLEGGARARGAARRTPSLVPRGPRLLLARAARGFPCRDDAAGAGATPGGDETGRADGGPRTRARPVLRRASGSRRDAQELRDPLAPLDPSALCGAGRRQG